MNLTRVVFIAKTLTTIAMLEPIPTIQATTIMATHAWSNLKAKAAAFTVALSKPFQPRCRKASTSDQMADTRITTTPQPKQQTIEADLIQCKKDMLDTIQVFFMRNEFRAPVVCVAVVLNAPKPNAAKALFAISVHNPHDPFDRELARHVAIQRLIKYHDVHMVDFGGPGLHRRIATYIASHNFPQRAREAANLYLMKTHEITNDPNHINNDHEADGA